MYPKRRLVDRLKRGAVLGTVCAALTFLILVLFQRNLAIGTIVAALVVILVYFVLNRFL